MNTGVTRRAFVGTVTAGLPMAAGAALLAQSSQGSAHNHPSGQGARDAVFDHLLAQLVAAHNRSRRNGLRGEDGRAAAAALRTLSVYTRQARLDDSVKRSMASVVARQGRENVLYPPLDSRAMLDEWRRLGMEGTIEPGRFGPPDDASRRRALDGLTRNGVSARFEILASQVQRLAADVDRRGGVSIVVRKAQHSYGGECSWMVDQMAYLEAEATIVCGAAVFFPTLLSLCGALSISLGLEQLYYTYWC